MLILQVAEKLLLTHLSSLTTEISEGKFIFHRISGVNTTNREEHHADLVTKPLQDPPHTRGTTTQGTEHKAIPAPAARNRRMCFFFKQQNL